MTMRYLLLLVLVLVAATDPAHAYSQFSSQGSLLRWEAPRVRWMVTDRGVPGVAPSAFQAALARAFQTWEDVPTASIAFEFAGFTSAEPFEDDGVSVIGFQDHPELENVLAATTFVIDDATGEILESDIFFNTSFPWSAATAADPLRFDVQTIGVHEIGHFVGLGHSALGETEMRAEGGRRVLASAAVMFPIALGAGSIVDRALQPDDIAGVSDLYPAAGFASSRGTVHGRVVRGGAPVIGAHVVVFNLRTRALVGGFALGDGGEFQVAGLEPGAHVLRVEPLDDADIDSFFDIDDIDIDFQVTYYPQLVAAPSGGASTAVDVTVRPK